MIAHTVDLQTQIETKDGEPTGVFRYRWRCCCKRTGEWCTGTVESGSHAEAGRSARTGGARHVAAMERAQAAAPGPRIEEHW